MPKTPAYYVRIDRRPDARAGSTRTYRGPMTKAAAHHLAASYIDPHGPDIVDVVHERRVLADVGGRWCLDQIMAAKPPTTA